MLVDRMGLEPTTSALRTPTKGRGKRLTRKGYPFRSGDRVSCALGFSWTLDCERVLAGGVSR